MKILAIDISGKVFKYDDSLYKSIMENIGSLDSFAFTCPYFSIEKGINPLNLYSFVPVRYRNSSQIWKRGLKIIEGLINYIRVARYVKEGHIDILHLQWLPFLEFCNIERLWLCHIKKICPQIRIVLTMHNIYPHDTSEQKKTTYRKRMAKIIPLLDAWIVHTKDAKKRLIYEYNIEKLRIHIIHHGVFVPNIPIPKRNRTDNKIRFLLFANQSLYKGTDILIDAVDSLPSTIKEKIDVRIMGSSDKTLFDDYREKAEQNHILWDNTFISESNLAQAVQDTDVLVYPYRAITQSGALLLGLFFQKPMIVSNLPAFIETLGEKYPKSLIFKTGDIQSLADTITSYVQGNSQMHDLSSLLQQIVKNNSWQSTAQKTIQLYHSLNK